MENCTAGRAGVCTGLCVPVPELQITPPSTKPLQAQEAKLVCEPTSRREKNKYLFIILH